MQESSCDCNISIQFSIVIISFASGCHIFKGNRGYLNTYGQCLSTVNIETDSYLWRMIILRYNMDLNEGQSFYLSLCLPLEQEIKEVDQHTAELDAFLLVPYLMLIL